MTKRQSFYRVILAFACSLLIMPFVNAIQAQETRTILLTSDLDWGLPGDIRFALSQEILQSIFQQNPCVIYEWVLEHPSATNVGDVGTLKTTEQEEAGADMFLNWVYRTVEGAPSQAFGHNGDTADIPTGRAFPEGSVQIQGHGDDRFCWMQENLRLFFQYYGW